MAKFTMDGLTEEQAIELAIWYDEQGEQDADIWFEMRGSIPTPFIDNSKHRIIDKDGNVTIFVHTS